MNPFELAHAELATPWAVAEVEAGLDALLLHGFEDGGFRYRVFGVRNGRGFSMSLGLPLLGGGEPVVRGRIADAANGCTLIASVGARLELLLFGWFWILVTLLGAGVQLVLQWSRVVRDGAPWSVVAEVLPGIAILATCTFGGIALWRWRARRRVTQWFAALARAVGRSGPSGSTVPIVTWTSPPTA